MAIDQVNILLSERQPLGVDQLVVFQQDAVGKVGISRAVGNDPSPGKLDDPVRIGVCIVDVVRDDQDQAVTRELLE